MGLGYVEAFLDCSKASGAYSSAQSGSSDVILRLGSPVLRVHISGLLMI